MIPCIKQITQNIDIHRELVQSGIYTRETKHNYRINLTTINRGHNSDFLTILTEPANKAQILMTNMMLNTAEPTTAPNPMSSCN